MNVSKNIIKTLRENLNLTQVEFAKKINSNQSSVAAWERMGIETPKKADLQICEAFDMQLWELYAPEEIKNKKTSYSNQEIKMITNIRKLSPEKQKHINDLIEFLKP